MTTQSRDHYVGFILLALVLLLGSTAGSAVAQEDKCRDTIVKEAGKYVKAQTKTLTKCNDALLKAKSGFNGVQGRGCRDLAGKTQEKLDKAQSKFAAKVDKKCGGDDKVCGTVDDLDIDHPDIGWGGSGPYGNGFTGMCPDFESIGCTNVVRHCGGVASDGDGITDCVICINDEVVDQTMDLLYENLDAAKFGAKSDPDKTINKCQQAMVKASAKHVLSKSKTLGKCWASLDKGKDGFSSSDAEGCIDASGKTLSKIDKSESKKIAAICKKCGGDDKACDQVIPTLQGTLVKGAMGEGVGGDLDPLLDIGFGTACPNVTLPYTPNTDCGTLDNLGSGATDDVIENMEEFVKCLDCVLGFKVDCSDRAVVPHHEDMPAECNTCVANTDGDDCPSSIEITADPFGTRLDSGWTGLSHDFDIPSNGRITLDVTNCDGATRPTCGECDLSGPVVNGGGEQFNNQRCRSDNSIKCTADSDCPVTDSCVFYFGVALPLSSGNVPICVTNEIVGAVTGTANIEAGTASSTVNLFSRVHVGVELAKPCPQCVPDPNDPGVNRCTAGLNVGEACNVDSQSSIFGPLSYDCPPTGGIGDLDIRLNPATGNQTITLSAANANCTGSGFTNELCFCSTCSNATADPCFTDADCPAATTCGGDRCLGGINNGDPCTGPSDCGGAPCDTPGQPTQPNQCTNGLCTPDPNDPDSIDEGVCTTGPFDALCSIERFRGCSVNADCRPLSENGTCSECAPGLQTCNFESRQCYTADGSPGDDVEVEGTADPGCGSFATPRLGTFFCIPPTESPSTNAVGGLPGLGRLDLKVETRYQ